MPRPHSTLNRPGANRRPTIAVLASTVLAMSVGGVIWLSNRSEGAAPARRAEAAAKADRVAEREMVPFASPEAKKGYRSQYDLTLDNHTDVDSKTAASIHVAGQWTTTDLLNGRTQVELAPASVLYVGDEAPPADELTKPFVLLSKDGVLDRIAFAPGTTERAKQLLTSVATAVQLTKGAGTSWAAVEPDLSGMYDARYSRHGNTIDRTRGRYASMRESQGFADHGRTVPLLSDDHTEFVVDRQGIASEKSHLIQSANLGRGIPIVQIGVEATLARTNSSELTLEAGPDFTPEEIRSHYDRSARDRNRLLSTVAGASPEQLLSAAEDAAHLDRKAQGAQHARHAAMDRMTAMVKLDPETAQTLARAIEDHANDPRFVDLASGALAGAGTASATNELASTLGDKLPAASRQQVITSLALTGAPTSESAAALTNELGETDANQAALALGAEAKTLGDSNPVAQQAVATLQQECSGASDPEEKAVMLQALANTGSPSVLADMQAAIDGSDFTLAQLGAFGLRFIPGDDVDAELSSLIAGGSSVALQAIDAVGYRSPDMWTSRLEQFEQQYQGQTNVENTIKAILSRWSPQPAGQGTPE